jgi:hypothetical protein
MPVAYLLQLLLILWVFQQDPGNLVVIYAFCAGLLFIYQSVAPDGPSMRHAPPPKGNVRLGRNIAFDFYRYDTLIDQ